MYRNHTFYNARGPIDTAAGLLTPILRAFLLYESAAQDQIEFPDGSTITLKERKRI